MRRRAHIYYSGSVQGIGFRFTVECLVKDFTLTGWVKNLADGRVELVCEGEEQAIIDYLKAIRNGSLKSYIQNAEVSWGEASGEQKSFEIKYGR